MNDVIEVLNLMDDGVDMNFVLHLAEELTTPLPNVRVIKNKENQRSKVNHVKIARMYSDRNFVEQFTMSRTAVEELNGIIGHHLKLVNHLVPLDKKILFTLWMLGRQETFTSAGDHFGLATSTGHVVFVQIITALSEMSDSMIVWPDEEGCLQSAEAFEEWSCGISGVVGIIDTTLVEIKQPVSNAVDYHIGNNHHDVIIQAVCDHKRRFTNVFAEMPGRMRKADVFRNSPLYECLTCGENSLLPPNMHIIGDSSYPLLQSVLTPFRNNGRLSEEQAMFNVKLGSIRSTIEESFAHLKRKFRRLSYVDTNNLNLLSKIIIACSVLHNFIINVDGWSVINETGETDDATILQHELEQCNRGGEKRNHMVSLIR